MLAPLGFYFGTNYEEYEQTSGEIRLASPTGQTLEWMISAYYHDADLYTDQPNTIDVGKFYGTFLGLPEELVVAQLLGAPLLELWGADLTQNSKLLSPFIRYLESVGFIATDGWPRVYG